MQNHIEKRVCDLAVYILENKATVRAAAARFGISKSTVHKDLTERLPRLRPALYREVRSLLDRNKAERHMEIFHRTDPLKLFKSQCPEGVVFEQEELDGILSAAREKIAKAKEYAVSCEYPDPSEYLTDVYAE